MPLSLLILSYENHSASEVFKNNELLKINTNFITLNEIFITFKNIYFYIYILLIIEEEVITK